MPSPEYLALKALNIPTRESVGDMWLCKRLGIVHVFNGHKTGRGMSSKRAILNGFHLYHWGNPDLTGIVCNWRDCDPNAYASVPANDSSEKWEYVGNIFDMIPYEEISGEHFVGRYRRQTVFKEKP
jgi:hypothetical protein